MDKHNTLRSNYLSMNFSCNRPVLRVRRGLFPQGKALPDNASTVRRSVRRTVSDFQRVVRLQKATRVATSQIVRTTAVTAFIAVGLAFGIRLYITNSQIPLLPPSVSPTVITNVITVAEAPVEVEQAEPSASPEVERELQMSEMYAFAESWYKNNPDDIAGAIYRFEGVMRGTRGTQYGLMARQQIRDLRQLRSEKIQSHMEILRAETKALVDAKKFSEAIGVVLAYAGVYAEETSRPRKAMARELEAQKLIWQQNVQKESEQEKQSRKKSIESLVILLLSDALPLAIDTVIEMQKDNAFDAETDALREVFEILKKAATIDDKIMASFEAQRGETIDVQLSSGIRTLTIGLVKTDVVECREALSVGRGGVRKYSIGITDLSIGEQFLRMGSDSLHEVTLVKGIMAFQAKAYDHAEKYFGLTHPWLSEQLLRSLRGDSAVRSHSVESLSN